MIALHFIWQSARENIFFNISKIPFYLLTFLHCIVSASHILLQNSTCQTFLAAQSHILPENHIEMTCIECFVACQQLLLYEYYNWHI